MPALQLPCRTRGFHLLLALLPGLVFILQPPPRSGRSIRRSTSHPDGPRCPAESCRCHRRRRRRHHRLGRLPDRAGERHLCPACERLRSGAVGRERHHCLRRSGPQDAVAMIPDGSGGAILAWDDQRSGLSYDIYAQRIDSLGSPSGPPGGSQSAPQRVTKTIRPSPPTAKAGRSSSGTTGAQPAMHRISTHSASPPPDRSNGPQMAFRYSRPPSTPFSFTCNFEQWGARHLCKLDGRP